MNREIQPNNIIFRDTVLGVVLLVSALVLAAFSAATAGVVHTTFIILNSALALGGLAFLQKAFKKDKYRLQTL